MHTTDVIIVGCRPAGASLAMRLAAAGLHVVVVDRATFPSPPQVPSNPLIYPSSMALLDELGIPEASYAAGATKVEHALIEFEGRFRAPMRFPQVHGRAYVYGLSREHFDGVLRRHLAGAPRVTVREGFSVNALALEKERIVGVTSAGGETLTARVAVVGCDGRFSRVAQLAGLEIVEARAEHESTVHFAEWEGVRPPVDGTDGTAHILTRGRGQSVLFFPAGPGRVSVATQVRARDFAGPEAEAHYRQVIDRFPTAVARLVGAKQVGELVGLRRVGNAYREAGRTGLLLAGDALHHKDPLDGQGIYDALAEARIAADVLVSLSTGSRSWPDALGDYDARVRAETHAMFVATTERLKRELFDEPPGIIIDTVLRSLLQDPTYQDRFLRVLCRDVPAKGWLSAELVAGCLARGAARSVTRLFGGSGLRS